MAVYEYKYQSVLESEDKMLSDLAAILTKHDIQNPERYGFMLAVSEAFTNALLHGNVLNPNKTISLFIEIKPNRLSADIIDEGKGGIDKIERKKPSDLYDVGGRGVDLIRHYAGKVEFKEEKHGGVKVTVIFEIEKEKIT